MSPQQSPKRPTMALDELHVDPENARTRSEYAVGTIAASLERFGQQKPIVVDKRNRIIAGNGTYAAAQSLGWSDIWVEMTDLEGDDAVAFAIADNRTGELSDWDSEKLAASLAMLAENPDDELFDATGFTEHELEAIRRGFDVHGSSDLDDIEPSDDADVDKVPEGYAPPFKKMTFTIHDDDEETVERALSVMLSGDGDVGDPEKNANSRGRAIVAICETYLATANLAAKTGAV